MVLIMKYNTNLLDVIRMYIISLFNHDAFDIDTVVSINKKLEDLVNRLSNLNIPTVKIDIEKNQIQLIANDVTVDTESNTTTAGFRGVHNQRNTGKKVINEGWYGSSYSHSFISHDLFYNDRYSSSSYTENIPKDEILYEDYLYFKQINIPEYNGKIEIKTFGDGIGNRSSVNFKYTLSISVDLNIPNAGFTSIFDENVMTKILNDTLEGFEYTVETKIVKPINSEYTQYNKANIFSMYNTTTETRNIEDDVEYATNDNRWREYDIYTFKNGLEYVYCKHVYFFKYIENDKLYLTITGWGGYTEKSLSIDGGLNILPIPKITGNTCNPSYEHFDKQLIEFRNDNVDEKLNDIIIKVLTCNMFILKAGAISIKNALTDDQIIEIYQHVKNHPVYNNNSEQVYKEDLYRYFYEKLADNITFHGKNYDRWCNIKDIVEKFKDTLPENCSFTNGKYGRDETFYQGFNELIVIGRNSSIQHVNSYEEYYVLDSEKGWVRKR